MCLAADFQVSTEVKSLKSMLYAAHIVETAWVSKCYHEKKTKM